MKALVTGAAGFIGSTLAERLIADGADVVGSERGLVSEGNIGRHSVEQPSRRVRRGKNGARAVHHRAIERGVGGVADQRGDERHPT